MATKVPMATKVQMASKFQWQQKFQWQPTDPKDQKVQNVTLAVWLHM